MNNNNIYLRDMKLENPILANMLSCSQRFLLYRATPVKIIGDIDRNEESYTKYEKLLWWSLDSNLYLEPDTFILSGWMVLRLSLNAYDKKYYITNYKKWFIDNINLDFDKTSDSVHQNFRFIWLNLIEVQEHYKSVLTNKTINEFLSLTHCLANFMIIPKYFGRLKCFKFKESFVLSLLELEINFNKYLDNYKCIGINNFSEFIERFFLKCCYKKNNHGKYVLKEELKELPITKCDNYNSIIDKCELLINLVKDRAIEMQTYSNNKGDSD